MEKQTGGISGNGCGASFHVLPSPCFQTSSPSPENGINPRIHGFLQISGVVIFTAHDSNLLPRGTE